MTGPRKEDRRRTVWTVSRPLPHTPSRPSISLSDIRPRCSEEGRDVRGTRLSDGNPLWTGRNLWGDNECKRSKGASCSAFRVHRRAPRLGSVQTRPKVSTTSDPTQRWNGPNLILIGLQKIQDPMGTGFKKGRSNLGFICREGKSEH